VKVRVDLDSSGLSRTAHPRCGLLYWLLRTREETQAAQAERVLALL
jgi:hypothetical protein